MNLPGGCIEVKGGRAGEPRPILSRRELMAATMMTIGRIVVPTKEERGGGEPLSVEATAGRRGDEVDESGKPVHRADPCQGRHDRPGQGEEPPHPPRAHDGEG